MRIGEWIKQYRRINKMSMQEFADECDFSKAYVGILEKGVNPHNNKPISPTIETFKKIANGTHTDINILISSLDGDQPITIPAKAGSSGLSDREQQHLDKYRRLDNTGRDEVDKFTDYQLSQTADRRQTAEEAIKQESISG